MSEPEIQTIDHKYKGLSNEEITVIYTRFNKYLTDLEANLNKGVVNKIVKSPGGVYVDTIRLSEDDVRKFKQSEQYLFSKSVVDKLAPIVDLIVEEFPQLKSLKDG